MLREWEYIRVFAEGEWQDYDGGRGPSESQKQAAERWYALLNQRGAEGWELVVERYAHGGDHATPYWAQYAGTMKRLREPISN
jgi:hypothetical protein